MLAVELDDCPRLGYSCAEALPRERWCGVCTRRAHLADAVRAWVAERLRDAGTVEAVARAIFHSADDGTIGTAWDDEAAAALAAVAAVLTEGAS